MKHWSNCPNCNAAVYVNSRFCSNCGTQLVWQSEPQHLAEQNQNNTSTIKSTYRTSRTSIACYVIVGMLLIMFGNELSSQVQGTAIAAMVLQCIGVGFALYGGYLWAKLKGRNWAWMFTMIAVFVGIIVLPILKDRNNGKNTWVITGAVILAFMAVVLGTMVLGEIKFWGIITKAAIGWLPIILITGLVVLIINSINNKKKKY